MKTSREVRTEMVEKFRRDLIGPGLQDADLASERLNESPSRWYLAGFIAPAEDPLGLDGDPDNTDPSAQEEMELDVEEPDSEPHRDCRRLQFLRRRSHHGQYNTPKETPQLCA